MKDFNKHIFLIGFMGTGKSAISNELGKMTGLDVLDTDTLITDISGMGISEIFEKKGEDYFRALETEILHKISEFEVGIVSCGGGTALKDENVEIMKKAGKVILLTASAKTIYMRVKKDTQRPLLKNNLNVEYIEELMKKRQPAYDKAADIIIETDKKDILHICKEILINIRMLEGY